MKRTTRKPPIDLLKFVPELAKYAQTAVRLHPRRGKVAGLGASKIGGTFLWPKNEPWPTCPSSGCQDYEAPDDQNVYDGPHGALVPVLQFRAEDFPEIEFYPGTDLCQVLWCPVQHDAPYYAARPFVFWRKSKSVGTPLRKMPRPDRANPGLMPHPCKLCPERITEYPQDTCELPEATQKKLFAAMDTWNTEKFHQLFSETNTGDAHTFYDWVLSTCPGTKLGGYVSWVQDPRDRPVCKCGRPMQHLLTITDTECDGGTYYRWLAHEDRHLWDDNSDKLREAMEAIGLNAFVCSSMFLFVCRKCKKWPIGVAFQR